jgi:hypothetical protein
MVVASRPIEGALMATPTSRPTGQVPRTVSDLLVELVSIEADIQAGSESWAAVVQGHPEAAEIVDRMRAGSTSHRDALERRSSIGGHPRHPHSSAAAPIAEPPASASEALRAAGGRALAATLAYEAAYQVARLAYDGGACELFESHLGDHVATLVDVRRALPHTVARELRGDGVTCACGCPMCSLGACGCIRATLAMAHLAWDGEEPTRTAGLTLLSPPRPGSQLAEAGLEEGDRILAVDGEEVGENQDMQDGLRRHAVGEEARLEVERRTGERIELIVRRVA